MDNQVKQVSFDRPTLERFKQRVRTAIGLGQDTFLFDGDEYVVSYALYVIEYLEQKLL